MLGHWGLSRGVGEGGGGLGNLTNVIYEFFLGVVGKKRFVEIKEFSHRIEKRTLEGYLYLLTYLLSSLLSAFDFCLLFCHCLLT